VRQKESYNLQQQVSSAKDFIEEKTENLKIYESIKIEKTKSLFNNYLMKNRNDMEQMLDTLHKHFQGV